MKFSLLIVLLAALLASGALASSQSSAPGKQQVLYGHAKSVTRVGNRFELRFDPAWWLSGVAAEQACGCKPVPNDHVVIDETHRLLTFVVRKDARVSVLVRGRSARDGHDLGRRAGADSAGQEPAAPAAARAEGRLLDPGAADLPEPRRRPRPAVPAVGSMVAGVEEGRCEDACRPARAARRRRGGFALVGCGSERPSRSASPLDGRPRPPPSRPARSPRSSRSRSGSRATTGSSRCAARTRRRSSSRPRR